MIRSRSCLIGCESSNDDLTQTNICNEDDCKLYLETFDSNLSFARSEILSLMLVGQVDGSADRSVQFNISIMEGLVRSWFGGLYQPRTISAVPGSEDYINFGLYQPAFRILILTR